MKSWGIYKEYILPFAAVCLVVFAFAYAFHAQRSTPIKPPPVAPSTNPFGLVVAGTGFVEPSTDSSNQSLISVGSQISNVVVKVAVRVGQEVREGDLLFQLDPRSTQADLLVRQ